LAEEEFDALSDNRELRVVFDTSVIKADEKQLLRKDIRRFIEQQRAAPPDIAFAWYVPQMVMAERIYQMSQEALTYHAALTQLERTIGQSFGLTADAVNEAITQRAANALSALGVDVLTLDATSVDWWHLIDDAANRRAPFEANSEKGFRDAIILETFAQLVARSPQAEEDCRLAFLTGDKRLREAAEERFRNVRNVRVLADLPALEGLVNTLSSHVGEDYVKRISERAATYFYESLYVHGDLKGRLREACGVFFDEQLLIGTSPTWAVQPPVFDKKDKLRVSWVSRVNLVSQVERDLHPDAEHAESHFEALLISAFLRLQSEQGRPMPAGGSSVIPGTLWNVVNSADVRWSLRVAPGTDAFEEPQIDEISCRPSEWLPVPRPRGLLDFLARRAT
jgi:hypothetical protein